MTKTLLLIGTAFALLLSGCTSGLATTTTTQHEVTTLPATNVTEGTRVATTIPAYLDASTLLSHLGQAEVKYIDIREYEEYVDGHFAGFELIPLYAWIYHLDAASQDDSVQLYGGFPETPVPVFAESDAILESYFPKDQHLVLICRSGNRVNGLMALLVARGWDENMLHNAGGMLDYEGQAAYRDFVTTTAPPADWGVHEISGLTRLK